MNYIFDKKQKNLMNLNLVVKQYRQEMFVTIFVLIMQLGMIFIILNKPGGILYSYRRMGYFFSYLIHSVNTILLLIMYHGLYKKRKYIICYWLRIIYAVMLGIWGCAITFFDESAGNGITVFSCCTLTIAALVVMRPLCSWFIFIGLWLLINILLLFTPDMEINMFNHIVNSTFVTAVAIFISLRLNKGCEKDYISRQLLEQQYKEVQRANRKLNSLALTDALTHLNNRRYLEDYIAPVFENNIFVDQTVAGIMIDIDCFKQYNDTYGHQAGDECLCFLGKEILQLVEYKEFYAVRYGGEEFFLCRFGANLDEIKQVMEQLRQKVERDSFNETLNQNITISIGIHMDVVNNKLKLDDLIKDADAALYDAKSKGRNCIQVK